MSEENLRERAETAATVLFRIHLSVFSLSRKRQDRRREREEREREREETEKRKRRGQTKIKALLDEQARDESSRLEPLVASRTFLLQVSSILKLQNSNSNSPRAVEEHPRDAGIKGDAHGQLNQPRRAEEGPGRGHGGEPKKEEGRRPVLSFFLECCRPIDASEMGKHANARGLRPLFLLAKRTLRINFKRINHREKEWMKKVPPRGHTTFEIQRKKRGLECNLGARGGGAQNGAAAFRFPARYSRAGPCATTPRLFLCSSLE